MTAVLNRTKPGPASMMEEEEDHQKSSYLSKLSGANLSEIPPEAFVTRPLNPKWYFFYGTLTNPSQLTQVLRLDEPPPMYPAIVKSYTLASYKSYKVLLDVGTSADVVRGVAVQIHSEDEEKRLIHYETSVYRSKGVKIWFTAEGGEQSEGVIGRTFVFAGDPHSADVRRL